MRIPPCQEHKRAGLPLAKLLGTYRDSVGSYNTSGGFRSASAEQVFTSPEAALASGVGGIKLKVGHPCCPIRVTGRKASRSPRRCCPCTHQRLGWSERQRAAGAVARR